MEVIHDWHLVKKTRKNTMCDGCYKRIPKGTECWVSTCSDFGIGIYDCRMCDECNEFLKTLPHDYFENGEWNQGDLAIAREEMTSDTQEDGRT